MTGKMRHSLQMNDPLISVGVIADKNGTVNSVQFLGCKDKANMYANFIYLHLSYLPS